MQATGAHKEGTIDDGDAIHVEVEEDADDGLSWDQARTGEEALEGSKETFGSYERYKGTGSTLLRNGTTLSLSSVFGRLAERVRSLASHFGSHHGTGHQRRGLLPRHYFRVNFCLPFALLVFIVLWFVPSLGGSISAWTGRYWLISDEQGILTRLIDADGSFRSLKNFPSGKVGLWAELFHGEPSSASCNGNGRERMCVVQTAFCVDANGPFVITRDGLLPPELRHDINMVPGDGGSSDRPLHLKARSIDSVRELKVQYLDTDLLLYGHYAPAVPSHYLFNGIIPAWSALAEATNQTSRKYAERNFWLYRYATFQAASKSQLPVSSHYLTTGRELVNDPAEVSRSGFELLTPTRPVCFTRAVLGSGSRTPFRYSKRQIPHAHIASFETAAREYFTQNPGSAQKGSPDRCTVLSETHLHPARLPSEKQSMVVALVRTEQRKILNLDQIVRLLKNSPLVKAVKVIDVTQGCSIPAMVNLLKDVRILIGSPSDALAQGIFMPQSLSSTIVSVEARDYYVDHHAAMHTASGRRILNLTCRSAKCGYLDYKAAQDSFRMHGLDPEAEAIRGFLTAADMSTRATLLNLHQQKGGHRGILISAEEVYSTYANMAGRRLEFTRLIPLIELMIREGIDLIDREALRNYTYPQLAADGKACGPSCHWIMRRAIFSADGIYGPQWAKGEPRDWHPDD